MKKTVLTVAASSVVMLGTMAPEASAEKYSVEKNDTLWGIANQYSTTAQKLMDTNKLKADVIFPNQSLETGDNDEESKDTYTIKSGDTLSEIALDKGVTVEDLKEWNDLSSSLIVTGDELKIKDSGDNSEQTEEKSKDETSADSEKAEKEEAKDEEADAKAEEEADAKAEEEADAKAEEEADAKAEKEAEEQAEEEAEEQAEKEAEEQAEKEAEEQAEEEAEEQAEKEAEEQAEKEAEEQAEKEAEEQAEKE